MKRRGRRGANFLILLGLLGLTALGLVLWTRPPRPAPLVSHVRDLGHAPPVKLNVRLGWLANANSAGQIVALAQAYYLEEGLEVSLHEGGLADSSIAGVASGRDDLGFANGPELVIAARGAGAPLKIVAVIHQEGYHAFFAREDSGIESPRDWVGRRVGIKLGSPTYGHYRSILAQFGIDRSAIQEVPLTHDLRPFLAGELDVYPGARNNEAVSLEDRGLRLRYFFPADFGVPTMGNVLFTTDAMLRTRGETVRRFTRATMRGWRWCCRSENQGATVECLVAQHPRLDRSKEARALAMTIRFVGDGTVDRGKLAAIIQNQARLGGLEAPVSIGDITLPPERLAN